MKRKLLSLMLVFLMCVSLFPMSAMATSYSDTANHWAEAEIERWSSAGILTGSDGSFRPDDPITRAEMATIFDRVMAYRTKAENSFTDLGENWYTDAILRANAAGLMLGDGNTVRPNDKITRQEAAILVCRGIGLKEKSGSTDFADDSSIASWAKGYVNALYSAGLIAGMGDNRFAPTESINRASVVKMLDNAIKGFYAVSDEYTEDIQGNVVISKADVTLKNMKISGNLIIAEGVGDGDVTLDNVKVSGKVIARGGGANSIHITGGSQIGSIIIEKTDSGGIRIVSKDGSVVEAVFIDDGKDDIILTGSFKDVTIAADVPVTAAGANISNVNVTGEGASLTVDGSSKVEAVTLAETAVNASVVVKGEVGSLTANAEITVDNQGKITKAEINADNVIMDGNKPAEVVVDSSVTEPPKGSDGKPVESGGSGDGGGVIMPPADPKVANVSSLTDLLAALANSEKETININADISGIEDTIKVEHKLTLNGNNKKLTFKSLAGKDDGERNGILIMADGVTANKLNIIMADGENLKENDTTPEWDGVYGIQIYNSKDVTLKSCHIIGGDAAILVNSSKVKLEGITDVSDNQFGGIEVSKGKGLEVGGELTINGLVVNSTEAKDLPTVWVDGNDGGTVNGSNDLCRNEKTVEEKSQKHYFLSEISSQEALTDALNADYMKAINIIGDIDSNSDLTVAKESTLSIAPGKTLKMDPEKTLTVKGTLHNEGTIGSTDNYVQYVVDETNATVTGGGTFYGSILVKKDDVIIDGITVHNKGDASNENTWNRAAVYAYCKSITIENSTFEMNNENTNGICNGIVILPSNINVNYTISNNTVKGYLKEDGGYSSAGLTLSGGITKDFLGMTHASALASLEDEQDINIFTKNTFTNCKNDYQRETWISGNLELSCKSHSTGDNLLLAYAGNTAKYYITGDVVRKSSTEIKEGTELIVLEEASLTIADNATLTVKGTLVNNGTLVNHGILTISDTKQMAGSEGYEITKNGTLNVGNAKYISDSEDAIVKINNSAFILGNDDGGYTVTIPSGTTATIQKSNSKGDYYHHGAKDRILVESGGKLVMAKNFGNNGTIEVKGILEINEGVNLTATSDSGSPKTIKVYAGATAPNPFEAPTSSFTSYTWNGTTWEVRA